MAGIVCHSLTIEFTVLPDLFIFQIIHFYIFKIRKLEVLARDPTAINRTNANGVPFDPNGELLDASPGAIFVPGHCSGNAVFGL